MKRAKACESQLNNQPTNQQAHEQKMAHEQEKHQLGMEKAMAEATLSQDERTAKMVDDAAQRDMDRDAKRADAALAEMERAQQALKPPSDTK